MPHTARHATRSAQPERAPSGRALLEPRALIVLSALAAVRIAVPLTALTASRSKLPGLPRFDYVATTGDSSGFYAATREFLASWGRLPLAVLLGLVLVSIVGSVAVIWAWRGQKLGREWLIVLTAAGFALVVTAAVTEMNPPGAAVFGWPLVWSLPMLPYRAVGFPLDPDIAFGFGLVLSLLANVVTVFATALAGLYASGRRSIGLLAASLFGFWPLLVGLIGGSRGWGNGTWTVDAGLVMYTEPLSTALVTVALALLLRPQLTPTTLAFAGVALSLATAVKLTNAIAAVLALGLLAARLQRDRVLPYLAAALSFVPVVAAYWPKGYVALNRDPKYWPDTLFSPGYAFRSWNESLLFAPRTLLLLVPLALLGGFALRSWWPRLLLSAWILGNVAAYTFYAFTPHHPRFFFASLPAVFVLWSLGAATLVTLARSYVRGGRYT